MTTIISWLDMHPIFWPVFIFCARVVDVSMGTLRTMCVVRGLRFTAAILGFFEVGIWVTAVSGVLTHLEQWYNIVAYASGFATGNVIGIFIEQKLAIGMQMIRLISRSQSAAVAAGLRLAGYAVTEVKGQGLRGQVSISFVVAPRKETPTVMRVANQIDPEVVSTVEDVRSAHLHPITSSIPPAGWRQFMKRK
jgi:uncharacterized protein YebE (UPF0316 family)